MAKIDWTLLCDSAFFDKQDRLCIVGVIRKLPVATVPVMVREVTMVARLTEIQAIDELAISVGVVFPNGEHGARMGSADVSIDVMGEYIVATLRDIPLHEEGLYRFQIQLRGQPLRSIDLPVLAASRAGYAEIQ